MKPLVGSSPHHTKNTGDFIEQIKQVTLQADETITSYDVSALFTSVPKKLQSTSYKEDWNWTRNSIQEPT